MFDFGFSELLVIAVVALLVLGPERLPKAARFAGLWVRKARAQWYSVKSEFERELASDELKRSIGDPLGDLRSAVGEAGKELGDAGREVGDALRDTEALARAESDAATAVQDIPAAAQADEAAPVQPELENFALRPDPVPDPEATPPATRRRDPPTP